MNWPAAMKRKTAAAYLDMSEAAFLREVAAARLPMPFMIGGREHWRRDALDKAIDRMTGGVVEDWEAEFMERFRGKAA